MQTRHSLENLRASLSSISKSDYLAVDFETNAAPMWSDSLRILGVALATERSDKVVSAYVPLSHRFGGNIEGGIEVLTEFFNEYEGMLIMHNSVYDLQCLKVLGVSRDFFEQHLCTMVASWVINENKPIARSLNAVANMYLSGDQKEEAEVFKKTKKAMGWDGVPAEMMAPYAKKDAELAYRLGMLFLTKYPEKLKYWFERKCKTVRALSYMMSTGIKVNAVEASLGESTGKIIMSELETIIGCKPTGPKALTKLLNEDLGLPVITSPKTGKPTFDAKAMEEYERILETTQPDNPLAQYILEYRGWQKSTSAFYSTYLELVYPDGNIHPSYSMDRTVTGRLSCSEPNLQQIPRVSDKEWSKSLRNCFIPRDGYRLISIDYSQLELRIAAALSKEPHLLEVFADPSRDVFTEMAERLGMTRSATKTFVYSTQYGGGVNRISTVFNVSRAKATEMRKNFFETYPRFHRTSEAFKARAEQTRSVQIWSGRCRTFEYESEARKAFNVVCQGGAADIVEGALQRVYEYCADREFVAVRPLLQIHDEIVFEIKSDEVDEHTPKLVNLMESVPGNWPVVFRCDWKEWASK